MPSSVKKAFFSDFVFDVPEEVYEPAEDSFLFADNLEVDKGSRVLEVGTGSGILAIVAAKKAHKVIAIDLNPYAVRCANQNSKNNEIDDKIFFLAGNLFAPLKEGVLFDLILFNSPYVPSEEDETSFWLGRSWAGGITGRSVIDMFIIQAPKYLEKTGKILLMQSTLAGVDETINKFSNLGFTADIIADRSLPFFEKIVLIKAKYLT